MCENNSVKNFLTNDKTTILKNKCEKIWYFNIVIRCFNSEIQYFDSKIQCFNSEIRYFDCESLLQVNNLRRNKTIRDLVKEIFDTIYYIIEIALNA